jgi:tetratricopeptide (TPR) repeat protein
MDESGLKRLWNAIKPPPAIPRRESDLPPPTGPGALERLWNALKPPPGIHSEDERISQETKRRLRRLALGVAAIVVVGGAAWRVHLYLASAPMRAEKALQEGMHMAGVGDYSGAVERFSAAIGISPSMAAAYLQRGLALQNLNRPDAASEDFERAISRDSRLEPAHTALGTIYRQQGDLTRAMSELTVSINLNSNIEAYYQRGQIYESRGQHQQAIQDYDEAIHGEPDAPYVYRARAVSREAVGDHKGAEEDRTTADRLQTPH